MTQRAMALDAFRSDAAVVVSEQLSLSVVKAQLGTAGLALVSNSEGKLVGAVRSDAIARLVTRAPQTPVKMMPTVPFRAVAADQSLDDVRRWVRQGQLQVVVFEVGGAWRAIDVTEFDAT